MKSLFQLITTLLVSVAHLQSCKYNSVWYVPVPPGGDSEGSVVVRGGVQECAERGDQLLALPELEAWERKWKLVYTQ